MEVASVRDAAGVRAPSGLSAELQRDLESVILLANEANVLCAEFDVGVPSAHARGRAVRGAADTGGGQEEPGDRGEEHDAAVARPRSRLRRRHVERHGAEETWTKDALARRLDEWREVFAQRNEGELFTGEAAGGGGERARGSVEGDAQARHRGVAHRTSAYLLDTETSYSAIVGLDGERRGRSRCPPCPATAPGRR